MQTIKRITAEIGEECNVDVDILHDALSKLPAEMYLKLYHKMQEKVLGYPYWNGGGCCGTIGDSQKDNAKYYDEQPKVTKSYVVGESE
ncbi:hypothetical protein D3Z36_14530 [Lachnospiraceae bacterium]|nr:hypothetical protein [Lachnospiraceae bacterium]